MRLIGLHGKESNSVELFSFEIIFLEDQNLGWRWFLNYMKQEKIEAKLNFTMEIDSIETAKMERVMAESFFMEKKCNHPPKEQSCRKFLLV